MEEQNKWGDHNSREELIQRSDQRQSICDYELFRIIFETYEKKKETIEYLCDLVFKQDAWSFQFWYITPCQYGYQNIYKVHPIGKRNTVEFLFTKQKEYIEDYKPEKIFEQEYMESLTLEEKLHMKKEIIRALKDERDPNALDFLNKEIQGGYEKLSVIWCPGTK